MDAARAHLFIKGRVQGVFYRAFTRNIAVKLDLGGWVKNLYDGRVEAVFEGERALIERAIGHCGVGPPGSHIIDIEVNWEVYSGHEKGFEIKY